MIKTKLNARFERPLPQGYTRAPDDYTGPIYLESQIRAAVRQAKKDALLEAAVMFEGEILFPPDKLRHMAEEI